MKGVLASGAKVERNRVAILAALQITDELFRARAESEQVTESIVGLSDEVRRWLPPAKRSDGG